MTMDQSLLLSYLMEVPLSALVFLKTKNFSFGIGEGAHITATVGQNPDIPDSYGKISNFEVLNEVGLRSKLHNY